MELTEVEEGTIFSNYKDMCNKLDLEIKGGRSKEFQLKELERYFTLEKRGNSLVVTSVNYTPLAKQMGQTELLSNALLCYMKREYESGNKVLFMNSTYAMKILDMVNVNYGKYKYDYKALSNEIGVVKDHVEDFYKTVDDTFEKAITRIMKIVQCHKSCLMLAKGTIIAINKEDSVTYRFATIEDSKKILKAEEFAFNELKMSSLQEVLANGVYQLFKDECHSYLRANYDNTIVSYFTGYRIVMGEQITALKTQELLPQIATCNTQVVEQQIKNAKQRHKRSKNKSPFSRRTIDKLRATDDYVDGQEKIINTVIQKS